MASPAVLAMSASHASNGLRPRSCSSAAATAGSLSTINFSNARSCCLRHSMLRVRPVLKVSRSRRTVAGRTSHAMVASSQPLASQTGLDVLKRGGNAVDAAIAMAAVLNVTEPNMTGIGGDAFMMVYSAKTKKLEALNASGRAPRALTARALRPRRHRRQMPLVRHGDRSPCPARSTGGSRCSRSTGR